MKLSKSLHIALNIILHSKLRSWLTVIGIVIGVAAVIAIVSVGQGFQTDIQNQLGKLGSNTIFIAAGSLKAISDGSGHGEPRIGGSNVANPLTDKDIMAMKSITDIQYIEPMVTDTASIYYLGESTSLSITGVDASAWKQVVTSEIEKGRLLGLGDTSVIVIGSTIAEEIFKNKINLNSKLMINNKSFVVVGIFKRGNGGFSNDDRDIYMPIKPAQDILGKEEYKYDAIMIKVRNADNVDSVVDQITNKLRITRHVNKDTQDFAITSLKAIQETVSTILLGFTLFLGSIAAISLLVGSVGIANTMFTSVLEKTKEIGIMKALGAKNSDVMSIFLFTSGFIGLVGGLLGALIGIGIALLIPALGIGFTPGQPLTTTISPLFIILVLVFSIGLGMIAGAIPAYRGSKLNPVDALRYE